MTANVEIGVEAAKVFQALSMEETVDNVEHLLVAPRCLQNRILSMIDEEISYAKEGKEAYIGLKMNSLTDKKIYDKDLKVQLEEMFITMLSDNQKARQEDSHGNYEIVAVQETPLNSQEFFYDQAYMNVQKM